jgi:hypothetical protein
MYKQLPERKTRVVTDVDPMHVEERELIRQASQLEGGGFLGFLRTP